LALEVALIALSQKRKRSNCSYAKQKTVKQEQKLIAKIKTLTLDESLMVVVVRQAQLLMNGTAFDKLHGNNFLFVFRRLERTDWSADTTSACAHGCLFPIRFLAGE
jgi:hypothetical protein